jgi:hypothetical protein
MGARRESLPLHRWLKARQGVSDFLPAFLSLRLLFFEVPKMIIDLRRDACAPRAERGRLPNMERVPLASRALVSAGYDPETQTLELEWKGGRIYQYLAVPPGTYQWLLHACNKGAFVSRMINDRYQFRDVTPPPPGAQQDLAEALRASLVEEEPR